MELLDVVKIEEAIDLEVKAMEKLAFKRKIEIDTTEARGYILSSDLISNDDLPNFRKATMDGYAINYKDSRGASDTIPSILSLVEEIEIGHSPKKVLQRGEASKIYTGGMLPQGADSVIPIEYTETINEKLIGIMKPVFYMENVIEIGDDSKKGDIYEKRGRVIEAETMAMAASLGYDKLKVYDKLRCKILSTGDEIIPVTEKLIPAKARDVNSYMLKGLVEELGMTVSKVSQLKDDRDLIKEELSEDVDLIIVSGSSSKGNKDFVPDIIREFDPGLIYHGISIKPGKPTSLSINNETMILGLPGNPISAYVIFRTVFAEGFKRYFGIEDKIYIRASLSKNISNGGAQTKVCLVDLNRINEDYVADPIFGFSNNISLLKRAKGYIILDEYDEGLREGEIVEVRLIR